MARQAPEQQAPPVQRIRLRYAKRGTARFTSSRDFGRAFERALRRAEIPMAYSSGFSPHPRISYANASPTSAATEAEYLEIGLSEVCDPEKVRAALSEALPPGMDIVEAVEAERGALHDLLGVSAWAIDLGEVDHDLLAAAVDSLLAAPNCQVQRMTKSGMRDFDVRAAVVRLEALEGGRLHLLSVQGTPLVRPDDVVTALRAIEPALATGRPALLTRLAQGNLAGETAGVTNSAGESTPTLVDPLTGVTRPPW